MPETEPNTLKALARWTGTILAITTGVVSLFTGMQAFFVANHIETVLELVLFLILILGTLSVLPLGVLAVFRPRIAAHGIGFCWLIVIVAAYGSVPWRESVAWSVSDLLPMLLWWFALPIGMVALLLYGSPPEAAASAKSIEEKGSRVDREVVPPSVPERGISKLAGALVPRDRHRRAQWAAVILGILAGSRHLQGGAHLALRTVRIHDWINTAGISASSLALLPLTILGIWKPRLAAYILLACFTVALAYPVRASHGLGDMLAYFPWVAMPALPLAFVAGLFFYAVSPSERSDID